MPRRMQALFDTQGGTQSIERFLAHILHLSRQKSIFLPAVAKLNGKIVVAFSGISNGLHFCLSYSKYAVAILSSVFDEETDTCGNF